MKPVFVLAGQGIHCEVETARAYRAVGLTAQIVPLAELLGGARRLHDCALLHLPGGFSFGDQLGAGLVLADLLRHARLPNGRRLFDELIEFVEAGGHLLGVCNGFQALVRAGLLPNLSGGYEAEAALLPNAGEVFEDRWVTLHHDRLGALHLPVRHGEGRLVFVSQAHARAVEAAGQVFLRYTAADGSMAQYPDNPNGSWLDAAGLCDRTGRVLGLMPHPEAALWAELHPAWTRGQGSADGLRFFADLAARLQLRAPHTEPAS